MTRVDEARRAGARKGGFRLLRELGARSLPTYAATRDGQNEVVVVQWFARSGDPAELGLLLRDARALAKTFHPNIAVLESVELDSAPGASGDLVVASEVVPGVTLEDLLARTRADEPVGAPPLPLPILTRIVLDVLNGLSVLHGLKDGSGASLGTFHGEVCPANIVVDRDGVARLVNVLRSRPVRVASGSEGCGYASPESLEFDGATDARADIFSVGAILWEGLTGERLHDPSIRETSRILSRLREAELAKPAIDPASPFAALADVTMWALSFDRNGRFDTAEAMATEIRRIAGSSLASAAAVAALADPTTSGASDDDDDDELLGPRGSSPVIDESNLALEEAAAVLRAAPRSSPRGVVARAAFDAPTPLAPEVRHVVGLVAAPTAAHASREHAVATEKMPGAPKPRKLVTTTEKMALSLPTPGLELDAHGRPRPIQVVVATPGELRFASRPVGAPHASGARRRNVMIVMAASIVLAITTAGTALFTMGRSDATKTGATSLTGVPMDDGTLGPKAVTTGAHPNAHVAPSASASDERRAPTRPGTHDPRASSGPTPNTTKRPASSP